MLRKVVCNLVAIAISKSSSFYRGLTNTAEVVSADPRGSIWGKYTLDWYGVGRWGDVLGDGLAGVLSRDACGSCDWHRVNPDWD